MIRLESFRLVKGNRICSENTPLSCQGEQQ